MYFKPLSFLFCLFYTTLLVNATRPTISKNQHYIVQLKPTTDIDDFIPDLLKGILDLIGGLIGGTDGLLQDGTHLNKRTHPIHIFDTFDIDGSFKAISTKIADESVLGFMLKHFDDIVTIVPDDVIQFDLPKPSSLHRRYYMRTANQPDKTTKKHTTQVIKQKNAPWNLARISERKANLKAPYLYPKSAGHGVRVYVIDDGVNKNHQDFNGRVSWGFSAIGNDTTTKIGGGHGTHVSGIIAGQRYGVAKNATIVSVQVLGKNGQGTVSSLLTGIQWVVKDAKKHTKKSLVNMSLGIPSIAPGADTLNQAITAAAKSGLPIIVAAGNSASDACQVTPAGNPNVYTVGASDNTDTLDYRSCYGKCVDIIAPGINVESDYIGGKNATAIMSGTSMAAPHLTGIAALILQDLHNPTPKALFAALTSLGTKNVIKDNRPKTVNLLAYSDASKVKTATSNKSSN
ncbi:peptidase S8/S53 domain-containing protein [Chlamydoabsidia padenii]|nr:peptidase S8/S53 domain-containing protein [Chlamydoabsidia padenii]